MSRDYEPVPGKWYEDLDAEDTFQVLSVDPDEEIVRIQWPDREIQEIDLDSWHEMDLELAEPPDGWVDDVVPDEDDEDDDGEGPFPDGPPGKLFSMFARVCRSLGLDPEKVLDEAAAGKPFSFRTTGSPAAARRKRK